MTHTASRNCAASRSNSATVVRTMCASQNLTASRPQSESLMDHPVRRFGRHEVVGNDHLHIRKGEQVGQQFKKRFVHAMQFRRWASETRTNQSTASIQALPKARPLKR
jgi:hypothetical protein